MSWEKRFLSTTRGQIIALLRRAERTVAELAEALALTDNAVRVHLASLERDGLVERRGVRRGVGKPAYVYGLAAEAERLFPKAYGLALGRLLAVLEERYGAEEVEELLEEAGRRAVEGRSRPDGDPSARLAAAMAVVEELGGVVEVREGEEGLRIEGQSCPLGALVPEHPRVCRLVEALLSEVLGVTVRERCERGDRPRCAFDVALRGCGEPG
jgi:predicted ArsR family transcriptional regulator